MTLKSSFLVTLLLPAFKLPVVGHKSGTHIAVDANGELPKSNYLRFMNLSLTRFHSTVCLGQRMTEDWYQWHISVFLPNIFQ
jgi:hypothetical protein